VWSSRGLGGDLGLPIVNKILEQNGLRFISFAALFNRCFTEEEI
jgi:hypothetical protein